MNKSKNYNMEAIDMKSKLLFEDLVKKDNIEILEKSENIITDLYNIYNKYSDRLFFSVMENCGGIIIDNWIRLYGCGQLNVIEKNKKYNKENTVDIILGEDIIGGLFALKDGFVYYFAPDTLKWENLNIYYANYIDWLINSNEDVNKFYELYRWDTWKDDVSNISLDNGVSFYPPLFTKYNINERSKKVIPMDEIIGINMEI